MGRGGETARTRPACNCDSGTRCPLNAHSRSTDFIGKTAFITGSGRGIGRAVALGLGAAGARVILLARSARRLDDTRALLREQGVPAGRISVLPADPADEEDRGRAAAAAPAKGRIDILVNNAATVEPLGPRPASPRRTCALLRGQRGRPVPL